MPDYNQIIVDTSGWAPIKAVTNDEDIFFFIAIQFHHDLVRKCMAKIALLLQTIEKARKGDLPKKQPITVLADAKLIIRDLRDNMMKPNLGDSSKITFEEMLGEERSDRLDKAITVLENEIKTHENRLEPE